MCLLHYNRPEPHGVQSRCLDVNSWCNYCTKLFPTIFGMTGVFFKFKGCDLHSNFAGGCYPYLDVTTFHVEKLRHIFAFISSPKIKYTCINQIYLSMSDIQCYFLCDLSRIETRGIFQCRVFHKYLS